MPDTSSLADYDTFRRLPFETQASILRLFRDYAEPFGARDTGAEDTAEQLRDANGTLQEQNELLATLQTQLRDLGARYVLHQAQTEILRTALNRLTPPPISPPPISPPTRY